MITVDLLTQGIYSKCCVGLSYKRILFNMCEIYVLKWNCQWLVKYIEVGVDLQRDCSQRAPSDELDSHGGRVFLPIVEDEDD